MEDYDTAIKQYKKFLAERDPQRDTFPKGAFYINMAVCHFKSGKIAGGTENLQIAIKNKNTFPTPPAGIMAGFQAFCEASIAKKDEATMLDFLKKHRADVTFLPWESQPYSPVFMSLAATAMNAGLVNLAFELYALVPAPSKPKTACALPSGYWATTDVPFLTEHYLQQARVRKAARE